MENIGKRWNISLGTSIKSVLTTSFWLYESDSPFTWLPKLWKELKGEREIANKEPYKYILGLLNKIIANQDSYQATIVLQV